LWPRHRNALKKVLSESELLEVGVDPKARAENLGVAEYIACANLVSARGNP
jgi:16S rRNA A1518/A1519 N6-dimethyltransferase RsmA/KsgA/DIM1 with predicted DNA glycosylase/AP lyase activity